jgi:hypothetical protein
VADGWYWFLLREEYCWLVAGGWFILREKYCWLVADKPSEQAARLLLKPDISKAFDTISWQFVLEVLEARLDFLATLHDHHEGAAKWSAGELD